MNNNKKLKNIPIQKIILATVAAVGLLGVAVVAPNVFQVYRQFSRGNKYKKYDQKRNIEGAVGRLLKKNLIEFKITKKGKFIRLTEKGKQELAKYELGDLEIKKPKKWDKKWRVVIFDIKETRRGVREILRSALIRLGFVRLQNSVWVFPYECQELVIMLKSNLFLGKDVLYMTVDKLENDKWLTDVFGL